ncbi:hypothetical protein HYH02_011794 [Chlamydomonas schloesseri]|uniref:Archease domain-containing protein n=1 Tax=Chlamydomonas schloesseri TaxID=2026947 RepID=A0A835T816_9CHLO|nr:hypothetical protein HYH02_011794 [Chlamydomonas schloesseri]|eukprot:KAG2435499.1 hypothetical protein HYH02_011794 [Chlamydomonas schloesseri]
MGDGDAEAALPQRLNSRQRRREQQQEQQHQEQEVQEAGSHEAGEAGAAQAASTSGRHEGAHGLGEGSPGAAPCGAGTGPAPDGSDRDASLRPGLQPEGEPGGPTAGLEVEPVSTLEPLPEYRSAAVGNYQFEYLDHTADVQLHAWGSDLARAFEQCGLALFNYMSPLEHVRPLETRTYRAEGHDLASLLFGFLDELLFEFNTELFLAAEVRITRFDRQAFVIEAEGRGERFDRARHEVGTEVKAITYSAMSISEQEGDAEVFVIVDI